MRIIPGKTKVGLELFRGVTITDLIIGAVVFGLCVLVLMSAMPSKMVILCVILLLGVLMVVRIEDEPVYKMVIQIVLHCAAYHRQFERFTTVEGEASAEGGENEDKPMTRKEWKAEKRARKKEKKADDKLLHSHKLTKEQEDAIWLKRANQSKLKKTAKKKKASKSKTRSMDEIIGFTAIENGMIKYRGGYSGIVLEIPPVEFRFFSRYRRNNAIENGLGAVLRNVNADYSANIVKLDRPIYYDTYVEQEKEKVRQLRESFENGMIKEDELQSRVEVIYDRIRELDHLNSDNRVVVAGYFLVLYDKSVSQLRSHAADAVRTLENAAMHPHQLNDKELAVFLKYSNCMDFDEREIEGIDPKDYAEWAKPRNVRVRSSTVVVNDVITYNLRITKYPLTVDDAWLATVMSQPGTKVVIKAQPMDRGRSVRTIDHSLQELRGQFMNTGVDSKRIELQNHIESLEGILATLQTENEQLLCTNIYITAYDIVASRKDSTLHASKTAPYAQFENIRKSVRRLYREHGFRMNSLQFSQTEAFVGSQVNGYDPLMKEGRGIPSNSLAACFPWIFASICDDNGIKFGESDGVPVFIDFFRRDSERVNSNMVIVGKSGSGKSYATKSILTNLAAEDSKIFVLDPEDEYSELARNLHGKFINVGNAQYGRLNPFQIITSLSDDEEGGDTVSGSYATHLQFLEEFFTQILPDCNKDALEYLNALLDRLYTNMGITAETDLRALRPEDYPIFDDLYDAVLKEFQTANNDYIRTMLRTLMNYISKFSSDGRNANIWNGPSTITTEENFTVFNFQSMLANRNGTIANAQMLLVLKYIDNEIIKNREYNTKNHTKRKVIVVIDEAHVFIDAKYPVALDFMFQLAKRIRKYNGMQIVITQNIKDFVGSEELARKSTAIINACQYSFIFALAPNDMDDLCKLYEKAGGINEMEQEQIITAPRGQAFTIMSAQSRSTFTMHVPNETVAMFERNDYETHYFGTEAGQEYWDNFIGDGREKYEAAYAERHPLKEYEIAETPNRQRVTLVEMTEEELEKEQDALSARLAAQAEKAAQEERAAQAERAALAAAQKPAPAVRFEEAEEDEFFQIPEDPESFAAAVQAGGKSAVAAPPAYEQPAAYMPPAVAPAPRNDDGRVEMLMEQMLGVVQSMKELSYDAIMGRVQAMVQQQISSMPARAAEPAIRAAEGGEEALAADLTDLDLDFGDSTAQAAEDTASEIEDDLFGDMLADEEEPAAQEKAPDEDIDFSVDSFDFMNQLTNSLAEYASDIDAYTEMKMNGEMKRNITLAELTLLLREGIVGRHLA